MLKFIVDYLQCLRVIIHHVQECLNSELAFAAVVNVSVMCLCWSATYGNNGSAKSRPAFSLIDVSRFVNYLRNWAWVLALLRQSSTSVWNFPQYLPGGSQSNRPTNTSNSELMPDVLSLSIEKNEMNFWVLLLLVMKHGFIIIHQKEMQWKHVSPSSPKKFKVIILCPCWTWTSIVYIWIIMTSLHDVINKTMVGGVH